MASALLASRNEPYWGEPKVYMRKNPKLCPNPNPNPNFTQIANGHGSDHENQFHTMELDELTPSSAAASDNSSCFNRKPENLGHRRDCGGYVTFTISSYSRKELRELKRRLMSELDQVRSVSSRIESRELQPSFRSAALLPISGSDTVIGRSVPKANEVKKRPETAAASPEMKKLHSGMMKKCGQILMKLMKHKGAIWFNSPVDVDGMGLHDYHVIIKNPMDLGTVKSKLSKGFYPSPLDFASDIRLTFTNALVYNPHGHDVHKLADQLLRQFEGSFDPAYTKYEKQRSAIVRDEEEQRQKPSSWGRVVPVPDSEMTAEPASVISPPLTQMKSPLPPPVQHQPKFQQQPLPQQPTMRIVKEPPKPKLNDPNKRPMSMKEKEKLGVAIQNLPENKMIDVIQIVSKRNETSKDGDEIEIDFELMDNETLWELDQFVVNWNKMMSKTKRRQETTANGYNFQDPSSAPALPLSIPSDAGNMSPAVASVTPEAVAAKKSKKGDPVDEDVDIGDEMPATHYPSVEIEKKESSSSSSGSSDSSSSSDSDSESSSGSDSDGGDAQSPAVGSRRSPQS